MRRAALLCCLFAGAAGAATVLVREWHVRIQVPARVEYPMAVCPDGRLYLSNKLGEVAMITAQGSLASSERDLDGFSRLRTMTCAADGTLWTAGGAGLVGYRQRIDGHLLEAARVKSPLPVYRLAVGDDRFYVHGFSGGPGSPPLHVLDRDGRILGSFGDRRAPYVPPGIVDFGFPLWDPAAHQLIFVPKLPYQIQVFDRDGRPVRVRPAPNGHILPVRDFERQVERILGVARLSDGRIVVQAFGVAGTGGGRGFVDVFDAELTPLETTIPAPFGVLLGASADGALYFAAAGTPALTITRTRLVER